MKKFQLATKWFNRAVLTLAVAWGLTGGIAPMLAVACVLITLPNSL